MGGNIMGLLGVTILAAIGTAVIAFDKMGKRHKKSSKSGTARHHDL